MALQTPAGTPALPRKGTGQEMHPKEDEEDESRLFVPNIILFFCK